MTRRSQRSTPRHHASRAGARAATEPQGSSVAPGPTLAAHQVFTRFWPLTRPYRFRLAVCLLSAAAGPAVAAAGTWMFKIASASPSPAR